MSNRIKLLVADDHPTVRKGVRSILRRHHHLEVVGEAGDGREALSKARELLPDIVLMDIEMPKFSGLEAANELRRELPRIKVLFLSMHRDRGYVSRVLESGARGYVLKEAPPKELVKAIETVHGGGSFFSPEISRIALERLVQANQEELKVKDLTERERNILSQVADGSSNKEIASHFGIGIRTVETHRDRLIGKLGIRSVAGLTRFAVASGLSQMPDEIRY